MTTAWNPTQYLQFGNERLQPAIDLLGRIPAQGPRTVYDLGCGPGTATVLLKARWPQAQVVGVDGSPEMLERARALDEHIQWQEGDLEAWQPDAPADVLFSNAVFQWMTGHETLFPRLVQALKPGGVLAVQMPSNFQAPSHTSIFAAVRNGPWRSRLEPIQRENPVFEPEAYYDILKPHVSRIELWQTTYFHILQGENPVVEWTKGSYLRPLLAALDEEEAQAFLEDYGARVRKAYPRRQGGETILPFKRLFFLAVR